MTITSPRFSLILFSLLIASFVTHAEVPVWQYEVIKRFRHDTHAYTQGLLIHNHTVYESTGLYGRSDLRRYAFADHEPDKIALPRRYFGEGIAVVGDRLYQLTWQEGIVYVYDVKSFKMLGRMRLPTQEGWGLTSNGKLMFMTDGSSTLYRILPNGFKIIAQVEVTADGKPVDKLNELEYIDGLIYANVYETDRIAVIDPDTGKIQAWLDLKGLTGPWTPTDPGAVLNGIAYDAKDQATYVTGKLWPWMYQIRVKK